MFSNPKHNNIPIAMYVLFISGHNTGHTPLYLEDFSFVEKQRM